MQQTAVQQAGQLARANSTPHTMVQAEPGEHRTAVPIHSQCSRRTGCPQHPSTPPQPRPFAGGSRPAKNEAGEGQNGVSQWQIGEHKQAGSRPQQQPRPTRPALQAVSIAQQVHCTQTARTCQKTSRPAVILVSALAWASSLPYTSTCSTCSIRIRQAGLRRVSSLACLEHGPSQPGPAQTNSTRSSGQPLPPTHNTSEPYSPSKFDQLTLKPWSLAMLQPASAIFFRSIALAPRLTAAGQGGVVGGVGGRMSSLASCCLLGVRCQQSQTNTLHVALHPPLQVMSTRALQSSMRLARASEEKPPNTTECTAPMRAHASMAMGSCGGRGRAGQ